LHEERIMPRSTLTGWVGWALVMLLSTGALASGQTLTPDAHGFIAANPEDLQPPEGSRSIRSVRILGQGSEPEIYVQRVTFAAGSGTRPHFHDQARYITVIEGTWWVALGPDAANYDPDKMIPMRAGSFLFEPANGIHYDQARDEPVTVQIMGMGPVKTTGIESDRQGASPGLLDPPR
jgi:quercetin dioxygenase-like cupin family protein